MPLSGKLAAKSCSIWRTMGRPNVGSRSDCSDLFKVCKLLVDFALVITGFSNTGITTLEASFSALLCLSVAMDSTYCQRGQQMRKTLACADFSACFAGVEGTADSA